MNDMKKKHTQALHVSVIGIDGSGKSTFAASLPMLLAAEYQLPGRRRRRNVCGEHP